MRVEYKSCSIEAYLAVLLEVYQQGRQIRSSPVLLGHLTRKCSCVVLTEQHRERCEGKPK